MRVYRGEESASRSLLVAPQLISSVAIRLNGLERINTKRTNMHAPSDNNCNKRELLSPHEREMRFAEKNLTPAIYQYCEIFAYLQK